MHPLTLGAPFGQVLAPAKWYSPHFATQPSPLVGAKLPGVREACERAIAAHEACELPWLTTVGWDCMLTDDGPTFFEGNDACARAPRRMFLSWGMLQEFITECRGKHGLTELRQVAAVAGRVRCA